MVNRKLISNYVFSSSINLDEPEAIIRVISLPLLLAIILVIMRASQTCCILLGCLIFLKTLVDPDTHPDNLIWLYLQIL